MPMQIIAKDATGKTCQLRHRLDRAVDDAIARSPGANSLVNVEFTVKGLCLEARGTAVRAGRP